MEHLIFRCKHCQREYTYCTYGNGPEYGTEAGCTKEYCSECQKAIDDALSGIKVKFGPVEIEIDGGEILPTLDEIKAREPQRYTVCLHPDSSYDNIDEFTHGWKKYVVKWNDDTPYDRHVFLVVTRDLIKDEVLKDKPWMADIGLDTYQHGTSMVRRFRRMAYGDVPENKLNKPDGRIMFMGFDYGLD